jgi:hypothetical protein
MQNTEEESFFLYDKSRTIAISVTLAKYEAISNERFFPHPYQIIIHNYVVIQR